MKLLVIVFALIPTLGHSQDGRSKEPFKGANAIIFKTTISDDSLYTLVGRKLVLEGFSIDANNKEFLQMKTGEKDTEYLDLKYTLTLTIAAGEIIARITVVTTGILGVTQWTYNPHKSTIFYKVQELVLDLLKEFGEIYYAKK